MGRASTARRAAPTPRRSRQKKGLEDASSTVAEQSSTPLAGKSDEPLRRRGKFPRPFDCHVIKRHPPAQGFAATYQPGKTKFDIQEREGQGLCVLLDEVWRPAIWHHEAVAGLDKEKYGVHLYDLEPVRSNDNLRPTDLTTFLAQQKGWGFGSESRTHRPDILFQLYPNVDQYPNSREPVPWLEIEIEGLPKVVLDILSQCPLRDFTNIPFQLATHVEGGRLEAMCREDCRIATEDFLQRMIPLLGEDGEPQQDENGVILSERPLKNVLKHVKTQFRNRCRCLSWNTPNHDSEFDKRLLSDLTSEDKGANTTKNLPDLTLTELTAVRSAAKRRKSKLTQATENSGDETAEKDTKNSDQHFTNEIVNQSTGECPSSEGITQKAEACNVRDSSTLRLDPVSERMIETVTVARRRRRGRPSTKKVSTDEAKTIGPGPSPSLTEGTVQNGPLTIDPNLTAPAVSELPTHSQEPLTKPDTFCHSSSVNQYDNSSKAAEHTSKADQTDDENQAAALLATAGGMENEDLDRDQPAPNSRHGRISDSDTVEVADQPRPVTESSVPASKRQKILPPAKDRDQVLNNFSAGQRAKTPITYVGGVEKPGSSSDGALRSLQRRSESPQPHSVHEATQPLPNSAPLIWQPAYSSGPPVPVSQEEQAKIFQAEQSRFASVSIKVSSLEILKANLLKNWWKNQVNTSTGGGLYGHKLNISLSQLGPSTSARTDAEMRRLLTSYNIPISWSASSVDLRQNQPLRQAVHEAMCHAERYNEHNYRKDFPGYLDLGREGGFFLAPAQQSSIKPGDCRFIPFASEQHLNASLHSATWRYRQLTGRGFAPTNGAPAFSAVACSYHDAWSEIRRQTFLPYFLRFTDPVEALSWMPELGMLSVWEGSPEMWETSRSHVTDEFGCRYDDQHHDGTRALDPRGFVGHGNGYGWKKKAGDREKISLPLVSVDLQAHAGV